MQRIDLKLFRAADAGLAHAAGDDRRVRSHPSARGKDALRDGHAVDVFGRGLGAHQDDRVLLVGTGFGDGIVRGEYDLADSRAGRGRQAGG